MSDISDDILDTLSIIGGAVMCILRELERHDLFKKILRSWMSPSSLASIK